MTLQFFGYIWANSWAFSLLLLLPIIYFFLHRLQKKKSTFQISSVALFRPWKNRGKAQLVIFNQFILLGAVALMILALARPQTMDSRVKRTLDGMDIVIVLDISDSMLIEDMKPSNRLESAKETISQFIQNRSSDRIGLVIFAGEAFTLVPPTLDYQLIMERVTQIQTARDARIKDGTAIGVALAAGAARLKDSQAKSKVMIFLTDGENNSGTIDPETGLEIAKGYGLKIYSVGIGKDGPTKLPIYSQDMFGNKFKRYQPFESTVNEDLLGQMAKLTGGKYFRANKEDSLQGIFNEINKLETVKIEDQKFVRYNEFYFVFLNWGLLLLLVHAVLNLTYLRRGP